MDDNRNDYRLVFSDEFEQAGRTFADGDDPRWTALDKNDDTNNPLHYYSAANAATTSSGTLALTTNLQRRNFTEYNPETRQYTSVTKEVRSAMVQGWNKFCFTGGIVEVAARLPGRPYTGGLWPALWLMGNLARATYVNSTERQWPFSTATTCDKRNVDSQEINACNTNNNRRGRGAPEIDLAEVMYISQINASMLSASLQVAPGLAEHRPVVGQTPNVRALLTVLTILKLDHADNRSHGGMESCTQHTFSKQNSLSVFSCFLFQWMDCCQQASWYQPQLGEGVTLNNYFYGVHVTHKDVQTNQTYEFQTDTISVNYWLDDSFWTKQHVYRVEWEPPSDEGIGGYISWFIDGHLIASINGSELQRVSQTEIPSEPMYVLMNVAVSKDWSFPDAWYLNCPTKCWSCFDPQCQCALPKGYCETFPSTMEIDYVRVYQAASDGRHTLGCSPPSHPTADFIAAHKERYMVPGQNTDEPLQPVAKGGGICVSDQDCGHDSHCVVAKRGKASTLKACRCKRGWTGPTCLAADPGNEEALNHGHTRSLGFLAFWVGLVIVSLLFVYVVWHRQYSERVLYDLLSDIESEKVASTNSHRQLSGTSPPTESNSSESLRVSNPVVLDTTISYQNEWENGLAR